MNKLWLSLLGAALIAAGCDDEPRERDEGSTTASATKASTSGSGGLGGMGGAANGGAGPGGMMGMIPDPGNQPSGEWTDMEPNNTPSQATPMGVLTGPIWAGFTDPLTAINPATDVDYFVFKTGDAASLANVYISLCWSFAGNLLDLTLYEVVNSMQGQVVASAATTGTGCETLVDVGEGTTLLQATTTYLLEVAAAPGLNLMGDPGLYSA
jgi:hypothetical protein